MENLYQDALKAHYKSPIGFNREISVSHQSDGYNASCGDEISLFLQIDANNTIVDIAFKADCCAICTASASILCQLSTNSNLATLNSCHQYLKQQLNNQAGENITQIDITEFECLLPVANHPSRINCALLPWQTAIAAINTPIDFEQTVLTNA